MDDRVLREAYNNGGALRHGNGYGAEGGNRIFNGIIDVIGTIAAGYEASDNHDDGYGIPGKSKASVDFGIFGDMIGGSVGNISQPAGLVRAGIGLAISPIYYGAVAGFGGPAYRAAQQNSVGWVGPRK